MPLVRSTTDHEVCRLGKTVMSFMKPPISRPRNVYARRVLGVLYDTMELSNKLEAEPSLICKRL
jgi:hypothetical protein